MERMEKKNRYFELLKKLGEEFKESEVPVRLFKEGEEGATFSLLRAGLSDYGRLDEGLLAEFFFLDTEQSSDSIMYFYSLLNIEEAVKKEYLPQVYEAVSKVNCYLQGGAFAVDAGGKTVVYKNTAYIPVTMSDDEVFSMMSIHAIHAMDLAEPFAKILSGISRGENKLEELLELLPEA